jgi:hypothetical protein
MQFQSVILALAASISLGAAVQIPDGTYMVEKFENGTQVYISSTDATLDPIVIHTESKRSTPDLLDRSAKFSPRALAKLAKRTLSCWSYGLDVSGVDRAITAMAEQWAGNGHELSSPAGKTVFSAVITEQVQLYYCINEGGKSGNLDREDVYYAVGQMDASCGRYQAAWFGWPGSFEILGKSRAGDSVCEGHMNGNPF